MAGLSKIPSAGFQDNVKFRNIIINGDMSIAQRGTSATGITSNTYATVDRFRTVASSLGTWTQSQSTDVPSGQGFISSLKMDCTSANASPSASSNLGIQQKFEGQNLQYLKKGTSSAESLTLSFWVKSNKTGTYIAEFFDNDNARQISQAYTISSANTWEKKTLTYDGDTSGALGNDNGNSLLVQFWLGTGSNYSSGTLSTTWTANTNTNRAPGQVNLADSTSNEWYITGVQLEAGTTASDFEFLPYDLNLQRCQRYCNALMDYGDGDVIGNRLYNADYLSTAGFVRMSIPRMRIQPTLTYTVFGGAVDGDYGSPDLIQLYDSNDNGWRIYDILAEAEL
jgi:hypothetical protein